MVPAARLRYIPYEEADDVPNVVVDGSPAASTVLVVSHWPGMPTPPGCAADTSAQMAFRYLDRGADLHGDATAVTNNHFDQDGLAGVYALSAPEDAMTRRQLVEGLALAGDFAVATDRAAARLSMAVAALADRDRTPLPFLPADAGEACAVLYDEALGLLPSWLEDAQRCRALWEDEDAELERGLADVRSGAVDIVEDPSVDLAIVTVPAEQRSAGHRFAGRHFAGVHPVALHGATERSVLLLLDPGGGHHHLTCRYEGWVQFRSRPIRPRVDLRPLADQLTAAETGGAEWAATPPGDLTPELHPADGGPGSSLELSVLVGTVTAFLESATPAWDPYPPMS